MSSVVSPNLLHTYDGSKLVPCHSESSHGGWDTAPVTDRQAIGTNFRPQLFTESPAIQRPGLLMWPDHYREDGELIWGTHFQQVNHRPVSPGDTAYILAQNVVEPPSQHPEFGIDENGDYQLTHGPYQLAAPIGQGRAHYYWLPNDTIGMLVANTYAIPGLETGSLTRYSYFDNAWELAFPDTLKTFEVTGWANGSRYSPPTLKGEAIITAYLNASYNPKPGVRDGDFRVAGYPPPTA